MVALTAMPNEIIKSAARTGPRGTVEENTKPVPVNATRPELPPILVGRHTPAVEAQVRSFYLSVAEIFERWVTRRSSTHTQRAYRQDVMDFVRFLGLRWPDESTRLFTVSVADVLAFRDQMLAESKAPKTINRRIASLSSFYKYLQGVASEFRLPITVPNPAHAQFIPRGSSDPRDETKALSATRARQLMGLNSGDTVFDYRDRAIIKFFLYSGARIGTACRLRVKDFHQDGDEATVTLHEKGDKHRRIGLHFGGGRGDRGVHREGRAHEGAALSRPAQLAEQKARSSAHRRGHDVQPGPGLPRGSPRRCGKKR